METLKLSLKERADHATAAREDGRRVVTFMRTHRPFKRIFLAESLLVDIAATLLRGLPVVLQNLAICRCVSYGLLSALRLW